MADQVIQYTEEMVGANHPTKADTLNRALLVEHNADGTHKTGPELVSNLKPVRNATANYLDIFTKTGGAVADSDNKIKVAIPDGNGHTYREDAGAYLSGTRQIRMADGANYWSKGSRDGEIKTAWLYAIWDGTGIVWALGGYPGITNVSTTTTATDDNYLLLEQGSTYTRNAAHYCVAVAKINYEYDTADSPDHTIQAGIGVQWNPPLAFDKRKTYGASISIGVGVDAAYEDTDATNAAITFTPPATSLYEVRFQFPIYFYSDVNAVPAFQMNIGLHDGAAVVSEQYLAHSAQPGSGARTFSSFPVMLAVQKRLQAGVSSTFKLQHRVLSVTNVGGISVQLAETLALLITVKAVQE